MQATQDASDFMKRNGFNHIFNIKNLFFLRTIINKKLKKKELFRLLREKERNRKGFVLTKMKKCGLLLCFTQTFTHTKKKSIVRKAITFYSINFIYNL